MKENLLVIDADYTIASIPTVRLFCKDEKGKTVLVLDSTFKPYFYSMPKEGKISQLKKKIEKLDAEKIEAKILKVETVERKWQGEKTKLIKITIDNPRRIPDVRHAIKNWKEVEETYEYDIPFYKRYIIDKQIEPMNWISVEGRGTENREGYQVDKIIEATSVKSIELEREVDFKILAFDTEWIEEDEKSKLIMLSLVCSDGLKKVLTCCEWEKKPSYVEALKDEKEMLERFLEIVKEKDPDFLVGYNSDGFDVPKLKDKSTELKISLKLGRNNTPVHVVRRGRISSAKTKGRIHIDLFNFIDHILSASMRSEVLTLDEVAQELLGVGKKKMKYKEMVEIWRKKEQLGRLAEYSLNDSVLTLKLSELILPQIFALCKLTGLLPFDVCRNTYSQLLEGFYIRRAFVDNVLIPNRPKTEEIERRRMIARYKGAIVVEPKKGIHSDILVFDFRSLPYFEEIYVMNNKNEIETVEIGKFVERNLNKNKIVWNNGKSLIAAANGWKALTFNEKTNKVEWRTIKGVIKHSNNFPFLIKLITEQNKEIIVTPNHSIFTLDKRARLKLINAREMKKGDYLISPKKIDVTEAKPVLDTIEILKNIEQNKTNDIRIFIPRRLLPYKRKLWSWLGILKEVSFRPLSVSELSLKLKLHKETIKRNIRELKKKKLVKRLNQKIEITKKGREFFLIISKFKKFSKRKYLFCPFNVLRDIHIPTYLKKKMYLKQNKSYWKRKIPAIWNITPLFCWAMGLYTAEGWCSKNRVWFSNTDFEIVQNLLVALKKLWPCKHEKRDGEVEIYVQCKILSLLFSQLFGNKSHSKKIDELFLTFPREHKIKLIEGLIDGDGSYKKNMLKYTSISNKLIKDVHLFLLSLRVYKTSFVGSSNLKNIHIFQNLGRFHIKQHARESHPLALVPRKYIENNLPKTLRWHHRGPRVNIERIMRNINIHNIPNSFKFFMGDCGIEKIKDIEKVTYNGNLYDISVEETEKFFAGKGPILVHNSLYPTIMVSHNIDPWTLNCKHEKCKEKNKVPETKWHFCIKTKGFIPKHLADLIERRKKVKEGMKKVKKNSKEWKRLNNEQFSLKILANASYGYTGYIAAKWYCKECAESTAAFGRFYITKVIGMARQEGFEIIYSDTDSCMVKLKS